MLQIRSCVEIIDGQLKVGKKYRGNFEGCLRRYVQDRLSGDGDIDFSRVFAPLLRNCALVKKDFEWVSND